MSCSELQSVAVCYSMLQRVRVQGSCVITEGLYVAVCCNVLQCVAVRACCSVLQCVAVGVRTGFVCLHKRLMC